MKIKYLSDLIISQIAAGEVIERPVSIVKEVVENAIDAGADKIFIQLEEGGQKKILIIDNGSGVEKEDLPMAFQRHATSKFEHLNDFNHLNTFGFRGEALSSISSVSKVTIETSVESHTGIGYKMKVFGGETVLEPTFTARSRGTTLLIEDLFYNIPVRKKFLKSSASETVLISDLISKFALLHPKVQFTLEQKGKTLVRTYPSEESLNNIGLIYGNEALKNMNKINYEEESMIITGCVSNATVAKRTKKQQTVGINGRLIQNPLLYQAIEESIRSYMPPGLNPIVVLNIQTRQEELDVNAHPRKEYIRFKDEEWIMEGIKKAIQSSIHAMQEKEQELPNVNNLVQYAQTNLNEESISFQILGQIKDTYILAEIFDKVMMIDQHAAHEAIIYHYLKESVLYQRDRMPKESLERPIVVEITPSQVVLMEKHIIDITSMGFNIEPFGQQSLIVREVPRGIDKEKIKIIVEEILNEGVSNKTDWLKNALIMTSCKSAIKANQKLEPEVMENMIRELVVNQITNCPHGRPLYFTMSIQEIERKFNRVV